MQYLVDFVDTASDQDINSWLTAANCTVVKSFQHFNKTYLVKSDTELTASGSVTGVHLDDETTAIKLLDITQTSPHPYVPLSVNTASENDWWKVVVFSDIINVESPIVARKGAGYPIYLMDSGIDSTHPEFVDSTIRNLFSLNGDFTDSAGHGTALASIMCGTTCGITNSEIVSVKIFQEDSPTLASDVLSALDAIATDYIANYNELPAVINMSWAIDRNSYVDDKIESLLQLGLVVSAAAGNAGMPIQNVTPAAINDVLTVGSIDHNLQPSSFSNYTGPLPTTQGEVNTGPGLDLWAPGENIYVALPNGAYGTVAGTSMSAAIVSATVAYNLATAVVTYNSVYTASVGNLMEDAVKTLPDITVVRGSIKDIVFGTNKLFPSKDLVQLTPAYENCPKAVMICRGLSVPFSEIQAQLNTSTPNLASLIYIPGIFIKKGVLTRTNLINAQQFDSFTIGDLPNGLSLEGTLIVGTMTDDLGTDVFKKYTIPLTIVRGSESLSTTFDIIYYNPASIDGTTYTAQQFMTDVKIRLLCTGCGNCTSYFGCCSYHYCYQYGLCPDGKTPNAGCRYY
jgi:hypothetical protein